MLYELPIFRISCKWSRSALPQNILSAQIYTLTANLSPSCVLSWLKSFAHQAGSLVLLSSVPSSDWHTWTLVCPSVLMWAGRMSGCLVQYLLGHLLWVILMLAGFLSNGLKTVSWFCEVKYAKNLMFNFHVFYRQLLLFYYSFTFSPRVLCVLFLVLMQAFFPSIGLFISKLYLDLLLYFSLYQNILYS